MCNALNLLTVCTTIRISWLLLVSLLSGSALSAAWAGVVGASLHLSGRLIGVSGHRINPLDIFEGSYCCT